MIEDEPKQYADRDIIALDNAGGYYCRHVSAMTGERLHAKSDIDRGAVMTFDVSNAIANVLNGLLREGWKARPTLSEGFAIAIDDGNCGRVYIHTPAEAAEFIREHLG